MLLSKMKKFTQLLQREGNDVKFTDLCAALRDEMDDTSIYVISHTGKILGYALEEALDTTPFDADWIGTGFAPDDLNSALLRVGALSEQEADTGEKLMIVPLLGSDRRVGSLLLVKASGSFGEDDIVMAEFA